MDMDYESDVQIDETALDVEWLRQPELMLKYTRHAAECELEMGKAKENLEFVKSELDLDIRSDPEEFGLVKITEGAVASAIHQNDSYQEAHKQLLTAKFEHGVASGAVKSMDQRCKAIENLVRLHGQSYFAGPSVPRDLSRSRADFESRNKAANRAVGSKIKTKRERK